MRSLWAQTRMEIVLNFRRRENLLASAIIPAGLLVFFTVVPVLPGTASRPVDSLLPRVTAISIIATAMVGLGIATGYERHYGVLKRLGATPLSRGALILAKAAAVVVIEAVQIALLLGVAALLGRRGGLDLLAAITGLGVGTLCFAGMGLLIAGRLRAETNLVVTNALFLLLLLFGGSLVMPSSLPAALQPLARALPSASLTQVFSSAMSGGGFPASAMVTLAVWAAVTVALASLSFSWEPAR